MRLRWIGLALLIFTIVGLTVFTLTITRYDQKGNLENTLRKGNYLVSLIALYPLEELKGEKSDFFLRTLTEYIASEGLVYCFIHDRDGKSLLSFAPKDLAQEIPETIRAKSLYTMGLTKQTFKIQGEGDTFYEFSKPIFKGSERRGTVRVGLKPNMTGMLNPERIGIIGIIAFLISSTIIFAYYMMTAAIKPLKKVCQEGVCTISVDPEHEVTLTDMNGNVVSILQGLEHSFLQLKDALKEKESDNLEMATKLGVTTFEKNQVSKIIDTINFGIIIIDVQDQINYINAFMLYLLKIERDQAIDHPISEILQHDEILTFLTESDSLKSNGSSHIETTFPELSPGEVYQVTCSYLKDDEDALIGKMLSVKNITREKASEKATHEFITNVAHEFLTPLTTIGSYNEMLMDGEVEDQELQIEFYNTISEETGRLSRLIQNLLSLAKIEMGSLTLNTGLVKTDWLVKDCIGAVETNATNKNITIKKQLPDQFPSLIGDKELLKTAVINILGNAVKYSPPERTISFSMMEEGNNVVFEVVDEGYGISEEDLPHIFDRFYRSKDANISEETGSGLGLAMTLEIIQLHGGEIEVSSELGVGTHFTIRIPKEEYYLGKE